MDELSYESLQELLRQERRSNKLVVVTADFWARARTLLAHATAEFRTAQHDDPWSRKAMLLSDEVKNARQAVQDLWTLRERKVAMIALARERDRKAPPGVTADEGTLYKDLLEVIEARRERVFEGTVARPKHHLPEAPSVPPAPPPAETPRVEPDASEGAQTPEGSVVQDEPGPMEKPPETPVVVPADVEGEPLVTIRAVADIPQFVGPDMQTYLLKDGDVATLPEGIAGLLIRRKKALAIAVA